MRIRARGSFRVENINSEYFIYNILNLCFVFSANGCIQEQRVHTIFSE